MTRPDPWGDPPAGFHFEAVPEDGDYKPWRIATPDERASRKCRHTTGRPGCANRPVLALDRGLQTRLGRVTCWWFYCAEHAYGRWIGDGHVMHWRLVRNEAA